LAVTYKGHSVGEYFADILVEDMLVVELKCVERLANEHTAQSLNYLRASGRTVCLLVDCQETQGRAEAYRPWVSDSRAA
jgi:GxxExxY protein